MAAKRTLNANNLQQLGAAALAELLMEVSTGNAVIQRRLRLALASTDGAEAAAQEVRKRLAAIARATTFVDSRKRKALLADLEAQHQAITGTIAAEDPALACELLVRLLELADGVIDRCSDTTGAVIGVFSQAAAHLGVMASAAQLPSDTLAEQVADLLIDNGYGQFDDLIPTLNEVLGEQGLQRLAQECRDRGAQDGHQALLQIAQCRGDVEAYLAQFNTAQLSWPNTAAEVAQYLLTAGRPEQALHVLEGAARGAASRTSPAWEEARLAVLEALGRLDEAQQLRWQCFCTTLAIPHLRQYLQRLEAFADVDAEESAFQVVDAHPVPLQALQFLVGWPALPRAARYVIAHEQDWDGGAFAIYGPAAERLSGNHPLAAVVLLRAMVCFALGMGRTTRYRYAVDDLRTCEQLAARIDDWQGIQEHHHFVETLRQRHAAQWRFWALLDR